MFLSIFLSISMLNEKNISFKIFHHISLSNSLVVRFARNGKKKQRKILRERNICLSIFLSIFLSISLLCEKYSFLSIFFPIFYRQISQKKKDNYWEKGTCFSRFCSLFECCVETKKQLLSFNMFLLFFCLNSLVVRFTRNGGKKNTEKNIERKEYLSLHVSLYFNALWKNIPFLQFFLYIFSL